jgi:NitT/TauT family transport system ATP-binding protein
MKKLLEFSSVNFAYQTKTDEILALKDLNFSIDKEDFVSFVGPSGCGKTTILSLISGLLKPSSGKILYENEDVSLHRNKIGYMFQRDLLFEWRTIWQNVKLGLEIQKPKDIDRKLELADSLLKKYDLHAFRNLKPSELSGGMRQRVALIRTLVLEPELLLLDEPFSALDFQTRLKVCDDVYSIIKSENKTAILVSHDIYEAISMSNKIFILSNRPASVKQEINVELTGKTPLLRREDAKSNLYFDNIWKQL